MSRLLYLASNNKHKQEELSQMLGDSFEVKIASDLGNLDWIEDGETFIDNARIKATELRKHTDAAVLADDSGLSVEVLNGKPGVHSSRFAGDDATDTQNNQKLIEELSQRDAFPASAKFHCVLVFVNEQGEEHVFEGSCAGQIVEKAKGAHGFGYDPHFYLPQLEKTMAELPADQKNSLSHRKDAVAKFQKFLREQ